MNRKIRTTINWLIVIAVVLGIGYLVYDVFFLSSGKSYSLEYGRIDIELPAQAIVLRDEQVIETHSSGQIQYMIAEGEKIKKNQLVAQIRIGEFPIAENSENEISNETIEIAVDIESLNYDIAFLLSKIRYAIQSGRYAEINPLKSDLLLKLDKRVRLTEVSGELPVVSEVTDAGVVQLRSPASGIVSYYLDGYEDVLLESNVYAIDFEQVALKLEDPVNHSAQYVHEMDQIYKVVDSNQWKLIALIDSYERDFFRDGQIVEITIGDERVEAQVIGLIEQSDKIAVLMDMKQLVIDFQKVRKTEVTLIPANYKGLLIENSSIKKVDGVYGVYVLNVSNKVDFVPIKIIGYDDDFAIVIEDVFTDHGDRIQTVSLYDEVIRNANSIKE